MDVILRYYNHLRMLDANPLVPTSEQYSIADRAAVAAAARKLMLLAAAQGLPALMQLLLPATQLGISSVAELIVCVDATFPDHWTLLHAAVASGSIELVGG